MRNVIIYTENGKSNIAGLINNDELDVRVVNVSELKDMGVLNPSLVIMEVSEAKFKELAMVTKFVYPMLIVSDKVYSDVTVRALAYDYIFTPVNKEELNIRVSNMVKIRELRDLVRLVSTTDELTGLHNRKYLQERLEGELSRARRYSTKVSCVLFDIDFFKTVNDIYGYDWGDVLLKRMAEMLKGLIRKEDILTRYGDEEFIVILPNTPEENAFLFAERFRRDIEKMEFIPAGEDERHPITVSGGISSYPFLENAEENANTLIRYAEHALYNAKKRGKNKIVQFSQVNIDY
ncbi:GGDEF domain-containing protein [bacterium]|nr:GGDEF domain-containing protein [bacterium]